MTQPVGRKYTPEEAAAAFWAKVEKVDDSCWLWRGSRDRLGYGVIKVRPRVVRAHRRAYALHHGVSLGPNDVICHHCDNPSCVNPAHLFRSSHSGNHADMVIKGRHARAVRHGRAKLTVDAVRAIRKAHDEGETYAALASRYGVSPATIGEICRGLIWKDVSPDA